MKRVFLAAAIALALGVAPIAAQTRVSVAVGFGVPRPFVTGVVVVGRPYVYYAPRHHFYRPPLIVVRRVHAVRYRRHHYCRHDYADDYDDD